MTEHFRPTAEMREWLDSLSPESRHEALDRLHALYAAAMGAAEHLDIVVDSLASHQVGDREETGKQLTALALSAESLRAHARGDWETAEQLAEASSEYFRSSGPIKITIVDRDER